MVLPKQELLRNNPDRTSEMLNERARVTERTHFVLGSFARRIDPNNPDNPYRAI